MKVLCEASWESETELGEDELPKIEKGQYYILHWGTTADTIETGDGGLAGLNYTVAICQDCKTGQIRTFLPEQIRILGEDISKLKTPKQ